MSSDSGARKRNVQNKKKKGSTGNISQGGISIREVPVAKSSPDELIHIQKDVQFGDNWCKVAVFFVVSSALLGVSYYVVTGTESLNLNQLGGSLTFDWLSSLNYIDFFSSSEPPQEVIDEEPSVDVQSESSYLDLLWAYYPFSQNDGSPPSEVSSKTTEQDDISKESENDKDPETAEQEDNISEESENDSKELNYDDGLENEKYDDENDQDDHESEEDLTDDRKDDDADEDQKSYDGDENDELNSVSDFEGTYESYKSYNHHNNRKHDVDDGFKKYRTNDEDLSDESKEQIDRRDQRYNYYHNRESEEVHKYEYIEGKDDPNDSSEQGSHERFDVEDVTTGENDENTKISEDDSHSSEEVEHEAGFLPEPPEEPVEPEVQEPAEEPQSASMVTKLSVGIALIFVAYSVIIRKWNNYVNRVGDDTGDFLGPIGNNNDDDLIDIAQTIAENILDSMNNDSNSFNDQSEADNKTLQDYLETPSNSANEQSEDDSENERMQEDNIPLDSEKSQTASETESETDEDYDHGKDKYDRINITNRVDWPYRRDLDEADNDWDRDDFESARTKYRDVLVKEPRSLRALYGITRAMDRNEELKKVRPYLIDIIRKYKSIMNASDVPQGLEKTAAEKAILRIRFLGDHDECVRLIKKYTKKYPEHLPFRVHLAISYLILDRLPEAKNLLEQVLRKDPDNGLALVNYGFIMKRNGKLERAVEVFSKGIYSDEDGTQDSRFYYHLGEALQRLGRTNEASKLYQKAAEKGIFLSKDQRSLYNVDIVKSKPWWTPSDTEYKDFFLNLERNWLKIKKEVEEIIKRGKYNAFRDEAEQLREKGEWKQLELFSRGVEHSACKKFPVTCGLIREFAPAAKCLRGQVKFSIMEPGTHVWPHCGPTNCRLRAHLGLIVPANVSIRVAEETRTWQEGKVLLFDDSFEHEVWHNGTSPRLILITDVWHPDLTDHERRTLSPI